MDNLDVFNKILRKAKNYQDGGETERRTQEEVQKAKDQIAELKKEQRSHFLALSIDDRRRMSEVVGLECLQRAYLSADELVTGTDVPTISDKQENSPDEGNITSKHIMPVGSPHELHESRTKASGDEDNVSRMNDEQVGGQCGTPDIVPIPHKRVEALRGIGSGTRRGPYSYLCPWLSAVEIEDLLSQNLEKQRVVVAQLRRSKEDILMGQVDLRQAEEAEGAILPRPSDNDVEAYLRAREVREWRISEEGDEGMESGNRNN